MRRSPGAIGAAWIGVIQVEDHGDVITYLGWLPLDQVTTAAC